VRLWPLAAALLAALGGGLFEHARLSPVMGSLDLENVGLEQRLASAAARVEQLQQERVALARELATLTSPKSRQVILAGLNEAPAATGFAIFDQQTRQARFYAFDLPELPSEKDYQLWVIAGDTPISAGLLERSADGTATVAVEGIPSTDTIQAWAVTIEPAGGLPQPSGSMVLLS
jgi:anti-sigma-K factor RskA